MVSLAGTTSYFISWLTNSQGISRFFHPLTTIESRARISRHLGVTNATEDIEKIKMKPDVMKSRCKHFIGEIGHIFVGAVLQASYLTRKILARAVGPGQITLDVRRASGST